jgi:hypothetical protein
MTIFGLETYNFAVVIEGLFELVSQEVRFGPLVYVAGFVVGKLD